MLNSTVANPIYQPITPILNYSNGANYLHINLIKNRSRLQKKNKKKTISFSTKQPKRRHRRIPKSSTSKGIKRKFLHNPIRNNVPFTAGLSPLEGAPRVTHLKSIITNRIKSCKETHTARLTLRPLENYFKG